MMEDLRPNLVGVGNLLGSNLTPPPLSFRAQFLEKLGSKWG